MKVFFSWLALGALISGICRQPNTEAAEISVSDGLRVQWLATEQFDGLLPLGLLNMAGSSQGHGTGIDAVYALDPTGWILSAADLGIPSARLYVLGAAPGQAALQVEAHLLMEQGAELYVSYTGDLQLYISASDASWQPGTQLNAGEHIRLPNDQTLICLYGVGGRLSERLLTESEPVGLDLAVRVDLQEPAGLRSGRLTFTLVTP